MSRVAVRLTVLMGLAVLLSMAAGSVAWAHFVFIRICPAAEGGRFAEVYFSELASAGDPRYIDKIANGKYWLQIKPGESQPLEMRKRSDRLQGRVPLDGPVMVAGQLDYGVLNRPMMAPFLLRHYSKAVAGNAAEVNQFRPQGSRVEIVPRFDADHVTLTALVDGKPVPGTTFTTVDADLAGEELKADSDGRVVFRPAAPSVYSIYIKHVDSTPGEYQGTPYKEIREFATLAFSWPLVASEPDAEAVKLFEDAIAARAVWQDFPGFTASIDGEVEGRPFAGTVAVAADGAVKLDLAEDVVEAWVQQQLESITMHRAASQKSPREARPRLRFADDRTDNPLGRLLAFDGGHFATSYRIKDRQIMVVNRRFDERDMTITVLSNAKNAEGFYLPESYTVQYWDAASGKLVRSESVRDRWQRIGKWDLPAEHTVATASEDGFSTRNLRLSKHAIASASAQ